jgi:O-antigen/teichoic acid export membrane protein
MASLGVLRALVSVHSALCRRELKMSLFAARALTGYVLGGAVGITLALLGWGVWSLVVCQIIQALVILVVMWIAISWRPKFRFSTRSFRHLAQFSRSFIAANILTSITEKVDSLVIGLILDVTAVGYYALALKVLQTVGLITMIPLQAIMMPVLARLTLQREKFVSEYTALVTASMATSLPAIAGIGVVASTVFPLAFGEHWASAVPVLRVMCFACFTMPLWNFTGQALSALGQPQYFARLAFAQLVLAAVSFAIAANFGLVAVAVASVGVSTLMVPLHLRVLQRSVGLILTPLLINAAKIALGGIAMVGVMVAARDVAGIGFAATCIQIAIGGMVYLALLEFLILPGYVVNLTRKAWAVLPVAGAAR